MPKYSKAPVPVFHSSLLLLKLYSADIDYDYYTTLRFHALPNRLYLHMKKNFDMHLQTLYVYSFWKSIQSKCPCLCTSPCCCYSSTIGSYFAFLCVKSVLETKQAKKRGGKPKQNISMSEDENGVQGERRQQQRKKLKTDYKNLFGWVREVQEMCVVSSLRQNMRV